MINKRGSSTIKLIFLFLIVLVLATGIFAVARSFSKTGTDIQMSADAYSIIKANGVGDRAVVKIEDKERVDKINEALSGKYKEGKRLPLINEDVVDFVCTITPIYKTDDYKKVDEYSVSSFHEDSEEGPVIYGEGIYIIDEKTIAYWDGEEDKGLWVGKKAGSKIDLDFLKSLME